MQLGGKHRQLQLTRDFERDTAAKLPALSVPPARDSMKVWFLFLLHLHKIVGFGHLVIY